VRKLRTLSQVGHYVFVTTLLVTSVVGQAPRRSTAKPILRVRYAQSLEQMLREGGQALRVRAINSKGWAVLMFTSETGEGSPDDFDSIFVSRIAPDLRKLGFQQVVYRTGNEFQCRPLAPKFKFRCTLVLAAMKEIFPDNPVQQQSPGYTFDQLKSTVLYKSKEEVQRILGNPDRVSEFSDGGQSWTYRDIAYDSLTKKVSSFTTIYFSKTGYAERISF
jgi:hypothetical protein